jgi:hypothetical protein
MLSEMIEAIKIYLYLICALPFIFCVVYLISYYFINRQ